MQQTKTVPRSRARNQAGFILALGLLLLASLALLGTAALSTAYFQNDMANSVRENQEAYYVATVGLSSALDRMLRDYPGNRRTREGGNPYLIKVFDRSNGQLIDAPVICTAGDHGCICENVDRRSCYDFYVEVLLKKCGKAQGSSGDKYVTLFYRLRATATGFHGNSSSVAVDVAGTYPGYCAMP